MEEDEAEFLSRVIDQEVNDFSKMMLDAERVETRAKTVYHKAAYNILAGVVEALLYATIHRMAELDSTLVGREKITYIPIQNLSGGALKTKLELCVARKEVRVLSTKDETKDFFTMLQFFKRHKVFNQNFLDRLDRIRLKRNQIHLQLRESTNRSYTRDHINKIIEVILMLINHLDTV